jgi:hypothetical protein
MDTQSDPDATYVLGRSDWELERLIEQARLYEPFTADFFRDAGLAPCCRNSNGWASRERVRLTRIH